MAGVVGYRILLPGFLVAAAVAVAGFVLLGHRSPSQPAPPPYPNPALASTVWSVPVAGGRPTVVFRDRGWQDSDPLVLPDGTIAFERPTSIATVGLFALRPGARHPREVRKLRMFAPLAYSSGRGEIAVQRGHAIVAETLGGRALRVLARVHGSSWSVPAWSPDGSTLAYAQTVRSATNPYQWELVILRRGTARRFRLAGTPDPLALSPRGDGLVFSWGSSLYVLDTRTGRKRLLALRGSPFAAWSSDGRTIAYDDARGLVLLDVASGRQRVVSRRGGMGAFTPDGRRLVFVTLDAHPISVP